MPWDIRKLAVMALFTVFISHGTYADEPCKTPHEINQNNNLIISGGTIEQPDNAKSMRAEYYSDNHYLQGYQYIEFNPCGQMSQYVTHYTQSSNGLTNRVESKLLTVSGNWILRYDLLSNLSANSQGNTETLNYHQRGNHAYNVNSRDQITSSENLFTTNEQYQGSGNSRYYFNASNRLSHYTTRSDDHYSSGDYYFTYDDAGKIISIQIPGNYITYIYDNQRRVLQISQIAVYSNGIFNRQLQCISWDAKDNCTEAVTDVLEIYPDKTLKQQFFTNVTYQYWDTQAYAK